MKTALITGANGFMGKNMLAALKKQDNIEVLMFNRDDNPALLQKHLEKADIVYHFAGVNRPENNEKFELVNAGLTKTMADSLENMAKKPVIVLASSVQAMLDNPYGKSKKHAEDILIQYAEKTGGQIHIYRLPNVFGKWCRPNYNSVVATFCHNISHDLDIVISDENRELELVYIDDVISKFVKILTQPESYKAMVYGEIIPRYKITLGELAKKVYELKNIRSSLTIPDMNDSLTRCLYATYLSYLDKKDFSYTLDMKTDQRGWLAELIKSRHFGQIFVSKTHAGVVRGNHFHNSKVEKFCVIQGEAVVKFRHILNGEILNYPVSGDKIEVLDIPPGYTHSIENTGKKELITLFWAGEMFDPEKPDTFFEKV
ncbi:MAG: NAD-dependent epimerase/dehydratase family protein [Desulfococcaceae bacterium]